jgi:hypothetical protein
MTIPIEPTDMLPDPGTDAGWVALENEAHHNGYPNAQAYLNAYEHGQINVGFAGYQPGNALTGFGQVQAYDRAAAQSGESLHDFAAQHTPEALAADRGELPTENPHGPGFDRHALRDEAHLHGYHSVADYVRAFENGNLDTSSVVPGTPNGFRQVEALAKAADDHGDSPDHYFHEHRHDHGGHDGGSSIPIEHGPVIEHGPIIEHGPVFEHGPIVLQEPDYTHDWDYGHLPGGTPIIPTDPEPAHGTVLDTSGVVHDDPLLHDWDWWKFTQAGHDIDPGQIDHSMDPGHDPARSGRQNDPGHDPTHGHDPGLDPTGGTSAPAASAGYPGPYVGPVSTGPDGTRNLPDGSHLAGEGSGTLRIYPNGNTQDLGGNYLGEYHGEYHAPGELRLDPTGGTGAIGPDHGMDGDPGDHFPRPDPGDYHLDVDGGPVTATGEGGRVVDSSTVTLSPDGSLSAMRQPNPGNEPVYDHAGDNGGRLVHENGPQLGGQQGQLVHETVHFGGGEQAPAGGGFASGSAPIQGGEPPQQTNEYHVTGGDQDTHTGSDENVHETPSHEQHSSESHDSDSHSSSSHHDDGGSQHSESHDSGGMEHHVG